MNEEALFHLALEKPPHERSDFLDDACAGNVELRRRVDSLLKAHDNPDSFLGKPVLDATGVNPNQPTHALDAEVAMHADKPAETQAEMSRQGDDDLTFLTPSTRPDSLGRLGHYEILEIVGKGGFGTVLKAFDERLHRIVAIKVLSPELSASGTARQRFIREARTAAAVTHEHVVTIHAVEAEHRPPYLVMQLIDGVTLQEKLDRTGMLGLREILRIGMQMAEGLAAAHKQGLVHRDIKPANVLLENGIERVKITDFGLAKIADDASVTQSGVVAGTPMYMSPEQANGDTTDHRSDLFSLGTVLYVMCTGRPPFRASGTMGVLKRVIDDTPRPIREINPELPDWLEEIINKLHAKSPADRYQTAREVADVLGQQLADLQSHGRALAGRAESRKAPVEVPAKETINRPLGAPGLNRFALISFLLFVVIAPLGVFLWSQYSKGTRGQVDYELDEPLVKIVINGGGDESTYGGITRVSEQRNTGVMHTLRAYDRAGKEYFTLEFNVEARGKTTVRVPAPPLGPIAEVPDKNGWEQLFNRKDLTGWKTHPVQSGNWRVVEGILIGSERQSFLFSEQEYANFHLRVEAKINQGGDSGIFFRAPFALRKAGKNLEHLSPTGGYEADLHRNPFNHQKTGSIYGLFAVTDDTRIKADEWFTLEVFAEANRLTTTVDGKQMATGDDPLKKYGKGHLALQVYNPATVVQFRKIEIKELRPPLAIAPFNAEKAKEHQDAWAEHLGVDLEITNSLGMKLRLIPPGEFTMGSTPGEIPLAIQEGIEFAIKRDWITAVENSSLRQHKVRHSKPFRLSTCEVTVEHFRVFVKETGYVTTAEKNDKADGHWQAPAWKLADTQPVCYLSWDDAREFCGWLSRREGRSYELPTEAQWEFACRAGSQGRWTFGDDPSLLRDHAWIGMPKNAGPADVGGKRANAFGLHDMHGNAQEWCLDWHEGHFYRESALVDPLCSDKEKNTALGRVTRGGWWNRRVFLNRSAARSFRVPHDTSVQSGFRVALIGDLKAKTPPPAVAPFNAEKAKAHQDAWATHLKMDAEITNSIGMKLRLIPPGVFRMGNTQEQITQVKKELADAGWPKSWTDAADGEGPSHMVQLTEPTYLGMHEVTVAQFRKFVEAENYKTEAESDGMGGKIPGDAGEYKHAAGTSWRKPWNFPVHDDQPVLQVSWNDSKAFCDWLSKKDGRTYRLPTEAEWEFACRAGSLGLYSFGDDPFEQKAYAVFHEAAPQKVGSRKANGFGLYDMEGNAWEWCADVFAPRYLGVAERNPRGPEKGAQRAYRGGGYSSLPWGCRCAMRFGDGPNERTFDTGFRVAVVNLGDPKAKLPRKALAP